MMNITFDVCQKILLGKQNWWVWLGLWAYPILSLIVQLHVCSTPRCTFQRRDSSWACWTFACYQELRVRWRELIFCLLEVHSLGLGRSLAHLAWLPCRGLSFSSSPPPPSPPPPPPASPHPLSCAPSPCMAAASPPADTCPAVTGRDVRWAADTRIDLLPFPHKLLIKLLETAGDKMGRGGRRENIVNSHPRFKLTVFGAAKE